MANLEAVLAHIDENLDASVAHLFDLLRIESVSTDPAYKDECRKAADWLVDDLTAIGFEASRRDTTGHPMVVGHAPGAAKGSGKHYLFYGHYDVQPVDPLNLWHRPPFDPAIEDTKQGKVIRGRGACDDKGQLMTFVEACRAWKAVNGTLPRLSILFEGEEESSSPSLVPFLKANKDELSVDMALVCDTGMFDKDTPAITTMLRGLVAEEFTITAADKDLHSGSFGGPAINPIRVLARVIAGLHDADGRITLPGFYDGVKPLPNSVKDAWDGLNFDAEGFLGGVDLSVPAGEKGFTALEQIWARPTCDVNGIWGGYTGAGFKTVLPSQASAKISFRLVGDQDGEAIAEAFRKYVRAALPADCTVEFNSKDTANATNMPIEAPEFTKAQKALSDEWNKPAVFIGCGGSIPIVGHFQGILEMDSLLIGFGQDDDQIHSPNEKYNLSSFHKGIRSWARILAALS